MSEPKDDDKPKPKPKPPKPTKQQDATEKRGEESPKDSAVIPITKDTKIVRNT